MLLFASSDKMMNQMKEIIWNEWTVTNLGEPTKIVRIKITCTRDSIFIFQQKYIEEILHNERMMDANAITRPMDPHLKLVPNPEENEPNRSNTFAHLIGQLQFVMNSTQPDILYAVNRLAAYTANLSLQHYSALKRILRYLSGMKNLGILY